MINNDKIFSCENYDPYINEQSEEGLITNLLNQHGKKVYTNDELKEQIEIIKDKYDNNLVKNRAEFDKLGGLMGLSFMNILKGIGPSGAKYKEYEGLYLYMTSRHGSFNWSNVFCFVKTGEKFDKKNKNRKPTMKLKSIACRIFDK